MRSAESFLLAVAVAAGCGGSSGGGSPGGSSTGGGGGGPSPSYTLRITIAGGGTVIGAPAAAGCSLPSCADTLPGGTAVTLSPAPAAGFVFGGWQGACAGAGSCSLTLRGDAAVTATFTAPAANALPLSVNGAACGGGSAAYANKPCVRATVCVPGTATCQVLDDLLLDTGSYGLRVFRSAVHLALPLASAGAGTLAECVQYLDGTSHWGPVATADVVLGGEPAVAVPIQLIDAAFGSVPTSCPSPERDPASAGFQGILGIGPFAHDCGSACATRADAGIYFACPASGSCAGVAVPLSSQVLNPVSALPLDNNGVVIDLPPVAPGGQASAEGALLLGIDTRANNASTGATAYPGDPATGDLRTTFDGAAGQGFLDTGSNGYFFPAPASGALPACPAPDGSWYCPAQVVSLSAVDSGVSGTPSGTVAFAIGNARSLLASGNEVLAELGGPIPRGSGFDFGLPFFYGHRVFVGLAGTSSGLGAGPCYGY